MKVKKQLFVVAFLLLGKDRKEKSNFKYIKITGLKRRGNE